MILFINTGIYDANISTCTYIRDNAKYHDKMDVFKYSLASLSKFYNWSKVIIYYQLGQEYAHREKELQSFIEEEFHGFNLITRNYRNQKQKQWQETYELFDDNLILQLQNHDHVVIDPEPSFINNVVENFANSEDYVTIPWSSFPEYISFSWTTLFNITEIELYNHYMTYKFDTPFANAINSYDIITKSLYHHWWFSGELPDLDFIRPDHWIHPIWDFLQLEKPKIVVPFRELGRHFDGYQHCVHKYINQRCPVLEIPNGFFEKEIRINYSNSYIDGSVNIDPTNADLKMYSSSGTDYNFDKTFMPSFWKNRVAEFNDGFEGKVSSAELKGAHISRVLNTWYGVPCKDPELYTLIIEALSYNYSLVK